MNMGRGLFRAWIVISVLWIIIASTAVYVIEARDIVRGSFKPEAMEPWIKYTAPRPPGA